MLFVKRGIAVKYEKRTVKTESFEMDYVVFGKGKKSFVMLPGISIKSVMLSAPAVAAAYARFADEYTVYLFDRKRNVKNGYTVRNMADDTAVAMKALGISDAYIFGASQGGMIAQYIAINHPELAHKLFLASSLSAQNELSKTVFNEMLRLTKERKVRELNRLFFKVVYSDEYREKYRDVFEFMENDGTEEELARFEVLVEACVTFDCSDEIDKIKCPVMTVGSKKDTVLSDKAILDTARLLGCEYYIYEGYAHAVYDEAPDYKDRIERFFKD